ncbi:uncharacterized protein LOC112463176 [Temnothorax curvispinosus]|uniref:Uncharacterized protein LOC112463176 n=1 Tax=Temnothorax curvispinosus TaxID=300111 RepID=A0A6J1QW80_9HYME|nr:uncharacterized protein LOC112463176 [Temnothorax curvispinosus]
MGDGAWVKVKWNRRVGLICKIASVDKVPDKITIKRKIAYSFVANLRRQQILLCLLSPAIFARPQNPNDEPFLPIHPIYPYSLKLFKRGTEGEANSQLTSELYAPKVDAKDTYSSSYSSNYQRASSYPDNNPYLTNSTPSYVYPSYHNSGEAYVYANVPYPAYNSYPASYAVNPASYPVPSYPNYYYQPPYYYPHYFTHALFLPPPPPPPSSSGIDYRETSQVPVAEGDKQDADKKGERANVDGTSQNAPQFVDGGNYIAGNSRDLDVQSSTYKLASPYNQLAGVQVKNLNLPISLPRTTYGVINVGGQSVSPDYSLPTAYVRAQQVEQMTSQALADLLAQNARQQSGHSYENSRDTLNYANDGSYENQGAYNPNAPSYMILSDARSKTGGVTYVIDSVGIAKVNGEQMKQQGASSQKASSKNAKYSNAYAQKPASRNHSQAATYISPESNHRARVSSNQSAGQSVKYGNYDASQSYGGTYSQSGNKQEQNYGTYQSQPGSYQSEGFVVAPQTPRLHSYQYSAYESDQVQQPQQDETNTNSGTFGTKQFKG